jgi:alkylation response protein AidB-like acyl-CoA dehydrogenase
MSPDRGTRREMLAAVDRFAAERVAPRAAAIDESGELPRDLWNEAAALGLFALGVPEEHGGLGRDVITPLLISERLARASAAFSLSFNNTTDSVVPIIMEGSAALKRRYLPGVAKGEIIPCIAITEPTGGSDMAGIRTRALREGDHYRLDGRKMWITNAPVGDVFTVFARTSEDRHRGLSAFVVDRGTSGLSTGEAEPLIGLRGSPTGEVVFEDVRIPVENRLGEEGDGFRIGALTLDESRLHCAAVSLGVATAALEQAVGYAKERVQFGKPIIEHQGLMFLLAELATELAAARALWETSAELLLTDHSRRATSYAAMTKLFCSDLCMKITTEAVQVLGANGLSRAYPVERLMRDAKAFQIYDGTSQIQKWLIGRQLQKSGLPYGPLEPGTGEA